MWSKPTAEPVRSGLASPPGSLLKSPLLVYSVRSIQRLAYFGYPREKPISSKAISYFYDTYNSPKDEGPPAYKRPGFQRAKQLRTAHVIIEARDALVESGDFSSLDEHSQEEVFAIKGYNLWEKTTYMQSTSLGKSQLLKMWEGSRSLAREYLPP